MLIVDDFLSNPDAVRDAGRAAQYEDFNAYDGETYKRISVVDIPEVKAGIEFLFDRPIELLGMAYRLNYEGEKPNNEIHADLEWGTYAAVLYLSEPATGESGTGFWQHHTGIDRIKKDDAAALEAVKDDWNDESKWERTRFVSSKYNSLVIYKSELFHSRWPFEAYGTTPKDGRLIVVVFFN